MNFDEISQQRILDSLRSAKLIGKPVFKNDIQQLLNRLNRVPKLFDFARFNTVDPVLLAAKYDERTKHKSYWQLLKDLKFVDRAPTAEEAPVLGFLSSELLSGKRPHELLLLRELLKKESASREEFTTLLETQAAKADDLTLSSVERVLSLSFYTSAQFQKYGASPLVVVEENEYRLDPDFRTLYETSPNDGRSTAEIFKNHVDDIIDTGLFLSREQGYWSGELKEGVMYSRREVCRLLNWPNNHDSTLYGYKRDAVTSTCPIFVTYEKEDDVSESTKYGDKFLSPHTLHWYSRSKRTLSSNELQPIINNEDDLHLFVKKSDAEGNDFYYLGKVESHNQQDHTMPVGEGSALDVVTMDLSLLTPVEQGLYDYLTKKVSS